VKTLHLEQVPSNLEMNGDAVHSPHFVYVLSLLFSDDIGDLFLSIVGQQVDQISFARKVEGKENPPGAIGIKQVPVLTQHLGGCIRQLASERPVARAHRS
jgi:hypothetical protein